MRLSRRSSIRSTTPFAYLGEGRNRRRHRPDLARDHAACRHWLAREERCQSYASTGFSRRNLDDARVVARSPQRIDAEHATVALKLTTGAINAPHRLDARLIDLSIRRKALSRSSRAAYRKSDSRLRRGFDACPWNRFGSSIPKPPFQRVDRLEASCCGIIWSSMTWNFAPCSKIRR